LRFALRHACCGTLFSDAPQQGIGAAMQKIKANAMYQAHGFSVRGRAGRKRRHLSMSELPHQCGSGAVAGWTAEQAAFKAFT
jgi:hypothetical protein